MRTADDVIKRIKWDPSIDSNFILVGYEDRFVGVLEKGFHDFKWGDIAMAEYHELSIPQHRIVYFKYNDEVIWDKEKRIDLVFGSTDSGVTLLDIAEKHGEAIEKMKSEGITSLSGNEDDEEKKSSLGDPSRPTHFLCLPLSHGANFVREVAEFHSHVRGKDSQLVEGLLPLSCLHVTLITLRCENEEEIRNASEVLSSCSDILSHFLPPYLCLSFSSLRTFRDRVLYTPPMEVGRLTGLVDALKLRLTEGGVKLRGNHTPFTPHATLLKLSRNLSRLFPGGIRQDIWWKKASNHFGEVATRGMCLCNMFGPKDPVNNFYKIECWVSNATSSLTRDLITVDDGHEMVKKFGKEGEDGGEEEKKGGDVEEQKGGGPMRNMDLILDELHLSSTTNGNFHPTLLVLRGMPGSGKSYFCSKLLEEVEGNVNGIVLSSDSFFYDPIEDEDLERSWLDESNEEHGLNGREDGFNISLLPRAHLWCFGKFNHILNNYSLHDPSSPPLLLILDNTNVLTNEYEKYVSVAGIKGLRVVFCEFCSSGGLSEVRQISQRNTHSVDTEKILGRYSSFEASLVNKGRVLPISSSQLTCNLSSRDAIADVLNNPDEPSNVLYYSVLLNEESRQRLFKAIPPTFPCWKYHHITLLFKPDPSQIQSLALNVPVIVHCTSVVEDENAQAVSVQLEVSDLHNEDIEPFISPHLHITLSHKRSVKPVYCRTLVEENSSMALSLDSPLILEGVTCFAVASFMSHDAKQVWYLRSPQDLITNIPLFPSLSTLFSVSSSNSIIGYSIPSHLPPSIKKVRIFDFDQTLLWTPERFTYEQRFGIVWPTTKGWVRNPESLSPLLPLKPHKAFASFISSSKDPSTINILLTGRCQIVLQEVKRCLRNMGTSFHFVFLKDSSSDSTVSSKAGAIANLIDTWVSEGKSSLEEIWMVDDNQKNLNMMRNLDVPSHLTYTVVDTEDLQKYPQFEENSDRDPLSLLLGELGILWGYDRQLKNTDVDSNTNQQILDILNTHLDSILAANNIPQGNLSKIYSFGSANFHKRGDFDYVIVLEENESVTLETVLTSLQTSSTLGNFSLLKSYLNIEMRCPLLNLTLLHQVEDGWNETVDVDILLTFVNIDSPLLDPEFDPIVEEFCPIEDYLPIDQSCKIALLGLNHLQSSPSIPRTNPVWDSVGQVLTFLSKLFKNSGCGHFSTFPGVRSFQTMRFISNTLRDNTGIDRFASSPFYLLTTVIQQLALVSKDEFEEILNKNTLDREMNGNKSLVPSLIINRLVSCCTRSSSILQSSKEVDDNSQLHAILCDLLKPSYSDIHHPTIFSLSFESLSKREYEGRLNQSLRHILDQNVSVFPFQVIKRSLDASSSNNHELAFLADGGEGTLSLVREEMQIMKERIYKQGGSMRWIERCPNDGEI